MGRRLEPSHGWKRGRSEAGQQTAMSSAFTPRGTWAGVFPFPPPRLSWKRGDDRPGSNLASHWLKSLGPKLPKKSGLKGGTSTWGQWRCSDRPNLTTRTEMGETSTASWQESQRTVNPQYVGCACRLREGRLRAPAHSQVLQEPVATRGRDAPIHPSAWKGRRGVLRTTSPWEVSTKFATKSSTQVNTRTRFLGDASVGK